MPKYEVTMVHRFEVETDDIRTVSKDYEFPDLAMPSVKQLEFLDGTFTYEEI